MSVRLLYLFESDAHVGDAGQYFPFHVVTDMNGDRVVFHQLNVRDMVVKLIAADATSFRHAVVVEQ